jgi:hypothetical protein
MLTYSNILIIKFNINSLFSVKKLKSFRVVIDIKITLLNTQRISSNYAHEI